MLQKLLKIIGSGNVHSFTEIAQTLDISTELLESMVEQLVHMGYLKPLNATCGGNCRACPMAAACAIAATGRIWLLTQAGQRVAQVDMD